MAIYPTKTSQLKLRKKMLGLGVSLISVFAILLLLVAFNVFEIFNILILGILGLFFYPICLFFITLGILIVCKKQIKASKSLIIFSCAWIVVFLLILQLATSKNLDQGLGNYIVSTFKYNITAGGVIFGTLLYPLYYLTHTVASYIILSTILVVISAFLIDKIRLEILSRNSLKVSDADFTEPTTDIDLEDEEPLEMAMDNEKTSEDNNDDNIFIADEEDEEKETARQILGFATNKKRTIKDLENIAETSDDDSDSIDMIASSEKEITKTQPQSKPNIIIHEEGFDSYSNQIKTTEGKPPIVKNSKEIEDEERRKAALDYLKISKGKFETKTMPKGLDNVTPNNETQKSSNIDNLGYQFKNQTNENNARLGKLTELTQRAENVQGNGLTAGVNPFASSQNTNDLYDSNLTKQSFNNNLKQGIPNDGYQPSDIKNTPNTISINNGFNRNNNITTNFVPKKAQAVYTGDVKEDIVEPTGPRVIQEHMNEVFAKPRTLDKKINKKPYVRPPLDLLRTYPTNIDQDQTYMSEKGQVIVDTLKAFRIETKVINATKGPTFTRFELQMAPGIPASAVTNKIDNLSMALESTCRLQVPIPGKNAFGVEVPNKQRLTVGLRDILESRNFKDNKSPLTFALGKNISGECKVGFIDKQVHTLVAGATNSGKSVCLHSMLISLLYKTSPEDLKLLLIDPKMVEFRAYGRLPHMLIPEPIIDCEKAVKALSWLVTEMDNRYRQLNKLRVKKISEYNETPEVLSGAVPKMFYIVMVFDEVGDFMTRAKKEIEENICLLAAKSRACGIHLILATQRPTVDVITGTIKANLPSRISFTVTNSVDSKTILDSSGAEYLLGMGDMLYLPSGSNDMERIQGCLIENDEINNITDFIRENNEAYFDEAIEDAMFNKHDDFDPTSHGAEDAFDPMLKDCVKFFIKSKKTSTTSLQTNFGIGYPKASKIIMQMEKAGFVSPGDANGRRVLYITAQEFEERFGEGIDE